MISRFSALRILFFLAVSCFFVAIMPLAAHADSARVINAEVQDTLSNFREQIHGADQVLREAKGILVFPHVYQAGFVLGGQYGEGAMLIHSRIHSYYRITSGSFGFQLGGQRKSIIIAFMTTPALDNFLNSSGWQVGADASAAVFLVGAEGGINSATLNKPIIAFVLDQKGLMYNLTLQGSKIQKIRK